MTKKELESAISNHADWIEHLGARMDELAAQMARTDAQLARTDAQIEDTNKTLKELGTATDKRIGDLVSAIGQLIAQGKP